MDDLNLNITEYLKNVRKNAYLMNINKNNIKIADKPPYKLMYEDKRQKIYFGRVPYKDVIIYRMLNDSEAEKHKERYLKRAFSDGFSKDLTPKNLTILNWN